MTDLICIIRSNPLNTDPRVQKIARSLSKSYNLLILGWDRENENNKHEIGGTSIEILRFPLKCQYGKPRLALFYPIFWLWIFLVLLSRRPKVIHACDFETTIPCIAFRFLFSTPVVFDSFDRYAMAFIPARYNRLSKIVGYMEDIVAIKSNILITVSDERLQSFHWKNSASFIIMNCPLDNRESRRSVISRNKTPQNKITVVYAGVIAWDRGLLEIAQALSELDNSTFLVAGRIVHPKLFRKLNTYQFVKYLGLLSHRESIMLQARADVIPLIYDSSQPINKIASPNKLFEAMMLGIPVISNVCASIINETKCGIVVTEDTKRISEVFRELYQSPDLLEEYGKNGRMAFEKLYNWNIMEVKLMDLYRQLLMS